MTGKKNMNLFGEPEEARVKRRGEHNLLLVTNHMNMQEILSSGLIKPMEGFPEKKHYTDLLSICPGLIPLFRDHIPGEALSRVVSEKSFLMPVAARIDASLFRAGNILGIMTNGKPRAMPFPPAARIKPAAFLFPGVLPATSITDLYFTSEEHKARFLEEIKEIINVSPEGIMLAVQENLFGKTLDAVMTGLKAQALPLRTVSIENFRHTEAAGGVLAHLALEAIVHPALIGLRNSLMAMPPKELPPESPAFTQSLASWLNATPQSTSEPDAIIFSGLLDRLSASPYSCPLPMQGCLKTVAITASSLGKPHQEAWKMMSRRLESMLLLGRETAESFFTDCENAVARGLALFLLTGGSAGLLDPDTLPWPVNQMDRLVARLLCGAFEGFTLLSASLRGDNGTRHEILSAVARLHNRINSINIHMGSENDLSTAGGAESLLAIFREADRNNPLVRGAALELCKTMKWNCVNTIVQLPQGTYGIDMRDGSIYLSIDDIASVEYEISWEKFFGVLENNTTTVPAEFQEQALASLKNASR